MSSSVDNAVILAAGFSSRFVPICFDIPKGLIPLRGETLIERQIRQLHEVGVSDITVVTGALAEQFEFLVGKYGVRLVYNADYASKNNFASLYAARNYLCDTIITSSDLYFPENIFQSTAKHAYYASVFSEGETRQRSLVLGKDDLIVGSGYGGKGVWITFGGHARFSKEVARRLVEYITPVYDDPAFSNKYWVDFQDEHIDEIPMYIKRLRSGAIVEFNTLAAIREFDPQFRAVDVSSSMRLLCERHSTSEEMLQDFSPIKVGNVSVGCTYTFNHQTYEFVK